MALIPETLRPATDAERAGRPGDWVLLAFDGEGREVGQIALTARGGECWLHDWRHDGDDATGGARLYLAAQNEARRLGYVEVMITVEYGNERMERFYGRLGYRPLATLCRKAITKEDSECGSR